MENISKKMNNNIELLAPAGNLENLDAALHFGADAVYLAYKQFGLRAFSGNFDYDGLVAAAKKVHFAGKKFYVTLNIFARNRDFDMLPDLLKVLSQIKADGVIVSDIGVVSFVKKYAPEIDVHLSTQANLTNKYAAAEYVKMGLSRLVLARELPLSNIREIKDHIGDTAELEAFVHGAMCISYSGRCLISNYLTNRAGNRGECAQCCRFEYTLTEKNSGKEMDIIEDGGETYLLNSKDLNMLNHVSDLIAAGVSSFKIEGRAKTAYYVSNTVNAYRRAIDIVLDGNTVPDYLSEELEKSSNRGYGTGFYFSDTANNENRITSKPIQKYEFIAKVLGNFDGGIIVEMRNRFRIGDELEVLSPDVNHNKTIKIEKMETESGENVEDAKLVLQRIKIYTDLTLSVGDMLRRNVD